MHGVQVAGGGRLTATASKFEGNRYAGVLVAQVQSLAPALSLFSWRSLALGLVIEL